MDDLQIKERLKDLAPWHIDVEIKPGLSTAASKEDGEHEGRFVSFLDPKDGFFNLVRKIYPDGMEGRRFFENACNCGAHCFWAKELGASTAFGYDVREHWIDQAMFLKEHRQYPSEGIWFEVRDLYDIPQLKLEPFHLTLFNGIFYHLPDPVTGLKIAADLTREVLVIDSACSSAFGPEQKRGYLAASTEGDRHLMSGVYRLNWFPSGPAVLEHLLRWMGFREFRLLYWKRKVEKPTRTGELKDTIGRLSLAASKIEGLLDGLKDAEPEEN